MHTAPAATVHVHPACASNPGVIAAIQAATGRLAVIHGGKPRLIPRQPARATAPTGDDLPPFGGDAA